MLQSIADLHDALREKELKALEVFDDVTHPGIIGDMYEGLTRALLEKTLFSQADLRVVTGFVRLAPGALSRQIDAMVVTGDGEQIPNTQHFIYPAEQVVAAVEVKKTLYGSELDAAYQNLRSLHHSGYLDRIPAQPLYNAYRRIAGGQLPSDGDMSKLPWDKELLAHTLMWDVAMPVRVVFGYDGYTSEKSLRDGMLDYIERVLTKSGSTPVSGYGPSNFPNLIVCGTHSLTKLNAMPFTALHDGDEWLFYASSKTRPAILLLELLWTRLVSLGLASNAIFGADMEIEQFSPLLLASPKRVGGAMGWLYRGEDLQQSVLDARSAVEPWQPVLLTDNEAVLLTYMCKRVAIDTSTDAFWRDWSADPKTTRDTTVAKLRLAGIAALDHDGMYRLQTDECQLVAHPKLGWLAADNSSGRFSRWLAADMTRIDV